MKPYYEESGIVIYHGDCREILPSLPKADLVLTDPPYGKGLYNSDVLVVSPLILTQWVKYFRCVCVFGWPEDLVSLLVDAGQKPTEWITWWPSNGTLRGFNLHGLWKESECIAVFGAHQFQIIRRKRSAFSLWVTQEWQDSSKRNGPELRAGQANNIEARMGDVWTSPSPHLGFTSAQRLHPNEKPISIMHWLVSGTSNQEDVILDPFMGSGTTLRAAKDLGRKAIGIEIEERYCEIAANRLRQEVLKFEACA